MNSHSRCFSSVKCFKDNGYGYKICSSMFYLPGPWRFLTFKRSMCTITTQTTKIKMPQYLIFIHFSRQLSKAESFSMSKSSVYSHTISGLSKICLNLFLIQYRRFPTYCNLSLFSSILITFIVANSYLKSTQKAIK